MELTLIVRTREELAGIVEDLVRGISDGLDAAKTSEGPHAFPPEDLEITVMFVTELNADTVAETTTTPSGTTTTTTTTPAHNVVTTEVIGAKTESSTSTPPNRTTTRLENGGDETDVNITYEEL